MNSKIIICVKLVKLCEGVTTTKSVITTRFHEVVRMTGLDGVERRTVQSVLCYKAVAINFVHNKCKKCKRMTMKVAGDNKENENPDSHIHVEQETSNNRAIPNIQEQIRAFFPGATDDMVLLIFQYIFS